MPDHDGLLFRRAVRDDVPPIVALLANDPLGATRESPTDPLPDAYHLAFDQIDRDPAQELIVAERDGEVVGVLQLTVIPSLTWRGTARGQIEGVRVRADTRGAGVGEAMFREAIARARARGCGIVQLTTDHSRPDALRFYERLGFRATHAGMKLHLSLLLLFALLACNPRAPLQTAVPDTATAVVRIQRPSVIAFWRVPVSDAELEAVPGFATALDDFVYLWADTRPLLDSLGIAALDQPGTRFTIESGAGPQSFPAHPDSAEIGYVMVAPGRPATTVYGVQSPDEVLRAARDYFGR